ncbi:hypothetical protein BOTBODRAFT_65151 [Botryobasidium botryosum FD-172 SS1]|uniref:Secreted protein n=1 Tax=Botryobasidium botryosum (strain FD-172 SS1) TaxID=930990 RepID=A0A067MK10_BOTB1|nr:hypothetical protein BOTBODRAFT_65151 [Botryobasidium botryosum FD-172 SS1]
MMTYACLAISFLVPGFSSASNLTFNQHLLRYLCQQVYKELLATRKKLLVFLSAQAPLSTSLPCCPSSFKFLPPSPPSSMRDQESKTRTTGLSDTLGSSDFSGRSSDRTSSSATYSGCTTCGRKRCCKGRRVGQDRRAHSAPKDPPRGSTDIKECVAGVDARTTEWEASERWSEKVLSHHKSHT